jgi:hypothetical protein
MSPNGLQTPADGWPASPAIRDVRDVRLPCERRFVDLPINELVVQKRLRELTIGG